MDLGKKEGIVVVERFKRESHATDFGMIGAQENFRRREIFHCQ